MRRILFISATMILCQLTAVGQEDGVRLEFEVASIKILPPAPPRTRISGYQSGGPGTDAPGRFSCASCSMGTLVKKAFNLRPDQFEPPDWMWSQQFRITANVPLGATKEQFLTMLQNLLIERFHLAYHFEKKEEQGYQLVVAKDGPRLKESVDGPVNSAPPTTVGSDGFPDRLGVSGVSRHRKLRMRKQTMSEFAITLTTQAGRPVSDATGIKGVYEITLYWTDGDGSSPAGSNSVTDDLIPEAPPLFRALQSQLGLKLEPKKLMVDVFVLDHIEKTPTEN